MNATLQSMRAVPASVPEPEVLEGSIIGISGPDQRSKAPSMGCMLRHVGPLPREALLMGLAEDGLPVLLNLWNPAPGPILAAGDTGTGKTAFLQVLAGFVHLQHKPHEVQYAVITDRPHEWHGHAGSSHCIGIFPIKERKTADFLHALAVWIDMARTSRQSILFLLDGIEQFITRHTGLEKDFRNILLHGPSARIWPVATLDLERPQNSHPCLKDFRTRVFGHTQYAGLLDVEAASQAGCSILSRGEEFTLKADGQWVKFHIPDPQTSFSHGIN
jgi:hypothetical protein